MIFLPFTLYHLFQNICSWTLYKVVSSSQIILPGLLLSAFLLPPFPSTALLTEVSLLNCLEMIKQLSSSHFPCSSLFTLHFLSSFSTLALLSEIMVFSYVFSLLPSPPHFPCSGLAFLKSRSLNLHQGGGKGEAGCKLQQVLIGEGWKLGRGKGLGGRRLLGIRFPSATLSSALTQVLCCQCSLPFLM